MDDRTGINLMQSCLLCGRPPGARASRVPATFSLLSDSSGTDRGPYLRLGAAACVASVVAGTAEFGGTGPMPVGPHPSLSRE